MAKDPAVAAHQEWLGYVQPAGLVASIPALIGARAFINRNIAPDHRRFLDALPTDRDGEPVPEIPNFPEFARAVFGWEPDDLWGAPGAPAPPATLEAPLPEYGETLRPSYALREFQPKESASEWILLVQALPAGTGLDAATLDAHHWQASPQARFERLLRETRLPTGLLVNGQQIRLVYAPKGEASGHITFNVADMVQVAGRSIFAALHMLLSAERLYSVAEDERLPAILANSRKYQNVVSTQLAGQVLEALYELLRGFQAADDQSHGELLRAVLKDEPNHVYAGLLTILLRLVFVLYAEDRGLLSTDPIFSNFYSVTGLYERLRADAGHYPDTMDQRYGAWAQLLALFRLIYRGGQHGGMRIPARDGYLFDPDRYLFLEGRQKRSDPPSIPQVSDGVLYWVLSKLMVLEGERLSYRTLAVEQIGSVYEATMGFDLQVAEGTSIAIKPAKKNGAPATINLEELLRLAPDKRQKWLSDATDQKLTGQAADALNSAVTIEDALAAMERKIARSVTPNIVSKGAMIFQPSDERRRSGSHYTPPTLTGPIVESALQPVLRQLGENPTPEQILSLKVCDPAMGSGAFLVEACRQLGYALVKAWHKHNQAPPIPPDEDELLLAMRQVARRCLYGVDKNPMAVELAKLSLWLATLAKDHAFTFLDHSLRPGDSLVGLTRGQIAAFNWEPGAASFPVQVLEKRIRLATEFRQRILSAPDDVPYAQMLQELDRADDSLSLPREVGDAAVAVFFSETKATARERRRMEMRVRVEQILRGSVLETLPAAPAGVTPFHWELEFPEVFTSDSGGFDVIVGNPPFAGKNTLIAAHPDGYLDWLKVTHEQSHGNSDLVAHFFRRGFTLLRSGGCLGLIATNTIGQGDTRSTGLRWICTHGGTIYQARKRLKWPGQAAVVVSVVHVSKRDTKAPFFLDGRAVPTITAYLFHAGGHEDATRLKANEGKSFIGSYVLGMGFTFDDTDTKGVATPLAEMERLIAKDPRNAEPIFPFISGEELNDSPTHAHSRCVINFKDWPLRRADLGAPWQGSEQELRRAWLRSGVVPLDYPESVAADYPDLLDIVVRKVKPERDALGGGSDAARRKRFWWQWGRYTPGLFSSIKGLPRVLVNALYGTHLSFVFLPAEMVFANKVCVMPFTKFELFAVLQSRVHELWARFFSATLKDDLAYAPSDCFETFPFPPGCEGSLTLEALGQNYYEFRAQLMQRESKGLTAIYNWFHDPECECPDIPMLRELHNAMDRAVLDAYDWTDISTRCEFIPEFDDEEDEDDNGSPRRKKYRYRWPNEIRDEVLARLLELNRQRALEEGQLPAELPAFAVADDFKPKRKGDRRSKEDLNKSLLPQEKEGA